jgi:hypothetical protein
MKPIVCKILFDQNSLNWIGELKARLSALNKIVPYPVDIIQIFHNIPRGADAFNLERLGTVRANELRIAIKPSEALRHLMTTLRTLDGNVNRISD